METGNLDTHIREEESELRGDQEHADQGMAESRRMKREGKCLWG
tara:strand:- start:315 stop:446 length:132 start_codon:yes stop_codon:yes gene_type:complete